jgi:hypothetical protein
MGGERRRERMPCSPIRLNLQNLLRLRRIAAVFNADQMARAS